MFYQGFVGCVADTPRFVYSVLGLYRVRDCRGFGVLRVLLGFRV